jgi:hypothetical protein
MKTKIIVTKNNSFYVNWQTEILYKSFLHYHKNDENFEFLAFVAKDQESGPIGYPYINLKYHNTINRDPYIVYNRMLSLKEYYETVTPSPDNVVVLLDPDMILSKPFDLFNNHEFDINTVIAQPYHYLNETDTIVFFQKHFSQHPDVKSFYAPIGCPLVINEVLLASIIDRWLDLTVRLRTTKIENSPFYKNWVCEMYALSFTLAEREINIKPTHLAGMIPYVGSDFQDIFYFYHYCYDIYISGRTPVFSKRSYTPWKQIKMDHTLSMMTNNFTKDFINKMNSYIKILGNSEQTKDMKKEVLITSIIPC